MGMSVKAAPRARRLLLVAVVTAVLALALAPTRASAADVVESGTCGTCPWELDSDGTLTIGAGTLASNDERKDNFWPWEEYDRDSKDSGDSEDSENSDQIGIKKIITSGKVLCGKSLHGCFSNQYSTEYIDLSGWDTSSVTDMSALFNGCYALTSLDLSGWDTSSVTDMSEMFDGTDLPSLDLSGWDTSSVTNMSNMFFYCDSLTSLDLSGWDTSSVTNMEGMFEYCQGLASLDVSGFNTSSVTNMGYMFYECRSLEGLDVTRWDTSNVTDMGSIFNQCYSLKNLDVSRWDTSSVTRMGAMFSATALVSLDLSSWDTSSVTTMDGMFSMCSNLNDVNLSGWNTSSVEYMYWMFYGCFRLERLDLSTWDTSKVKSMGEMFRGCTNLSSLDVTGFHTSTVQSMWNMFYGCSSLVSLDLSGWDTSSVANMGGMFNGCSSLKEVSLSDWNTSSVENVGGMFYKCSSLESLDFSGWDTSSVTDMNSMFVDCSSLTDVALSSWDTSSVTTMGGMFYNCSSLKSLDLSGWNTSFVTNMGGMFFNCSSLLSLNLSGWNVSSITRAVEMFANSTALETITVGEGWSLAALEDGTDMFLGCESLVGGCGTKYDPSHVDGEYARIDTPELPGYLTKKGTTHVEPGDTSIGWPELGYRDLTMSCEFGGVSTISVYWDDSWLSNGLDGYHYNHELGRACSVLAVAAYKGDCIEEDLKELGFAEVWSYFPDEDGGYKADWDECGYTFAIKTVVDEDTGKNVPVIAIVVRGTIGNGEWLSNFNVANSSPTRAPSTHEGFAQCRRRLLEDFDRWASNFKKHDWFEGLDLANARVFVTGHSRGAAVAGLVAAAFDDGHKVVSHEVSPSNVCAYTFASPTTSKLGQDKSQYDNVFNVVNPEDLIPKLPLGTWGYQRLGTTLVLPSKTNTGIFRYPKLRNAMNSVFERIAKGNSYKPYLLGSATARMAALQIQIGVPTVGALYDTGLWSVHSLILEPFSPHTDVETVVRGFIMDGSKALATAALADLMRQMPLATPLLVANFAGDYAGSLVFQRSTTKDHVVHGHTGETYVSWMMALDGVDDFAGTHTGLMVACPVDVRVYAPSGELVAEIVGGEVNEELLDGGLAAWVDGDAKCVELPDEEAYRVVLEPTADGEMDVVLTHRTAEDEVLEQLGYDGLPLEEGRAYELATTGAAGEQTPIAETTELTGPGSEHVEPDYDLTGDGLGSVSISATAEGPGVAHCQQVATRGDRVTARAVAAEGAAFLGWYEGGELVSADADYQFEAESDRELEARFAEEEATPSTVSVYRLYNTKTSEHLWTTSASEYRQLPVITGGDWRQEGVAWEAPDGEGTPVYRLYNRAMGDHYYSMDAGEIRALTTRHGWVVDNGGAPAFWSAGEADPGAIGLYCVYNGRLRKGQHHFTASAAERDFLVSRAGWRYEKVAFYGFAKEN